MPCEPDFCRSCQAAHLIADALQIVNSDYLVVESAEVVDCGEVRLVYYEPNGTVTVNISVETATTTM